MLINIAINYTSLNEENKVHLSDMYKSEILLDNAIVNSNEGF